MATEVDRVICFGDSRLLRMGLRPHERPNGFMPQLEQRYAELNADRDPAQELRRNGKSAVFYNLAVWASSTPRIVEGIETEVAARLRSCTASRDRTLFMVATGGHDSYVCSNGSTRVPIADFADATERMARTLQPLGRILYVGVTAVDEARVSEITSKPLRGWNEQRGEFEAVAAATYQDLGACTLRLYQDSVNDFGEGYAVCSDGVHPDLNGELWLYNKILPPFTQCLE